MVNVYNCVNFVKNCSFCLENPSLTTKQRSVRDFLSISWKRPFTKKSDADITDNAPRDNIEFAQKKCIFGIICDILQKNIFFGQPLKMDEFLF